MPHQDDIFIKCQSSEAKRNLFIFPHAGATPASYIAAVRKAKLDINVYVLSLPGRLFQNKKNAIDSFSDVFEMSVSFLKKFKNEQVFLLGHSMGCLFTYELAKYMQINLPDTLVAFAISAMKVPDHRFKAQKISYYDETKFKNHVEKYHFIPDEIKSNSEVYSDLLQTLKNDFKIIESYEQSLIFFNNKAKVFIFGFEKDLIAPPEDLLQWTEYFANYEGPIILPGDHFQFLESLPKILNSLLHACPNFS